MAKAVIGTDHQRRRELGDGVARIRELALRVRIDSNGDDLRVLAHDEYAFLARPFARGASSSTFVSKQLSPRNSLGLGYTTFGNLCGVLSIEGRRLGERPLLEELRQINRLAPKAVEIAELSVDRGFPAASFRP